MVQLQPGELGLVGPLTGMAERIERQVLQVPVIQRPVVSEFQRAQRMGDALDGIALAVCPVVGGVDAPAVAAAVVMLVTDAVHHRVAHLHVLVLHVDAGTQHPAALGMPAGGHLPEYRRKFSVTGRSRYGLSVPARPNPPRPAEMASAS